MQDKCFRKAHGFRPRAVTGSCTRTSEKRYFWKLEKKLPYRPEWRNAVPAQGGHHEDVRNRLAGGRRNVVFLRRLCPSQRQDHWCFLVELPGGALEDRRSGDENRHRSGRRQVYLG